MMEITLHVDIPALEHLAKALEGCTITNTVEQTHTVETVEAVAVPVEELKEVPEKAEEPAPSEEKVRESSVKSAEKAPEATVYTLDQVQRAAARMRDQGKLGDVTGMFGEFGIKKLSDLKDEKLQEFAGRLIGLGASL